MKPRKDEGMNADSNAGMKADLHERARRLIDRERVEGLDVPDQGWLADHLAACEACAGRAATTDATLRSLRAAPVNLPRGLAASTQFSVQRRAEELRAQHTRNVALAIGCTLSWVVGVVSAPLVWRICAWVGATLDLPRVVWMLGFAAWWFVPASAMVLVILWQRRSAERESAGGPLGPGWDGR
ncbi:MAG TPA: hypothetical protein VG860_07720 [Terriglobia bacterium]|jgi:hypothetical protein|nr:hypothetical protein [Terriglobia bacterium]